MVPFATQPSRVSSLLWQHYRRHLWVGLLIWVSAVVPIVSFQYFKERALITHDSLYANQLATHLDDLATNYLSLALMVLLCGFIPAIIGGLIRHYFLELIINSAFTYNELVWRSLLLFELSVLLAAFIPWPIAYNQFSLSMIGRQFLGAFVLSLPWLIATGLASRKLATSLALPHGSN